MEKKILFAAACITGSALFAQVVPQVREDSSRTLDPVIITANKIAQKQSTTGKVVTVITKEQIDKSSGKTLSEVLNQQVGISISGANNNFGTNQSLYIRGAHAANTLILVDGVPVYDASGETSQFDISNFSLYNIERIEILKGAQSTLYGSDAVAGVVNIITKKAGDKPVNLNAILSAGSYNTYKGSVAVNGKSKRGDNYFISYSTINSRGFSSAYDSTGKNNFDKDGFSQDAFQANYGFQPLKHLSSRIYGNYSSSKADIDAGAFADDKDFHYKYRNFQTGSVLKYLTGNTSVTFNYNYNWYHRDYTDDSVSVGGFAKYQKGNYKSKSHFTELYSNFKLDKNIDLLAGIDYRHNATDQDYFYLPNYGFLSPALSSDTTKSNQFSTYASFNLKYKNGFNTEIGARWNIHNIYGNNFTYSFNPSWLKNNFKIFANISSGYRVPSLYQLYSEFGNKNLKPEASENFETGVQYLEEKVNARVVVFKRDIKNVFAFYTDPVTFAGKYINEDRQEDHGVETEIFLGISDKINLSANYTWVTGKIFTKNFTGRDTAYNNFYRKPSHTLNVRINYQVMKDLFLSGHFKTISKFYEARFNAAPYEMKGYYTLDIYSEYKINKKCKLFADVQNITDQQYFDIRGFNSKRFNFNAGINLNL
ncbi:MAG TPA: TonB-dependent receptor [Chitinophagaceae bacterium]|nr:TonB-dependent receptor [Chitinophagaceae bacterium]